MHPGEARLQGRQRSRRQAEADAALARIDPAPPIDLPALATALWAWPRPPTAADILAAAEGGGAPSWPTALGLAATATADEVLAAAKTAKAGSAERSGSDRLRPARGVRPGRDAAERAARPSRADEQATAAVDDAIKAGKLAPAQRDWGLAAAKKDLAAFQSLRRRAPR